MTNAMEELVRGFLAVGDSESHQRVLEYVEEMKRSVDGWQHCATVLPTRLDELSRFVCLSVIEHYVKTLYASAGEQEQHVLRTMVTQYMASVGEADRPKDPVFVANKFAQIVTLIVLIDFPTRWQTFFSDLMAITMKPAWDMYLRILTAINQDIAERDLPRTPKEAARGTLIKDSMRETCIPQIVDTWYNILVTPGCEPSVYAQCLQTLAMYVSWIDLGLVFNDRMMPLLLSLLSRESEIREAAVECFTEVVHKGMDPAAKIQLIHSLLVALQPTLDAVSPATSDEEIDFVIKLSKMLNFMMTHTLVSCQRVSPRRNSDMDSEQLAIMQSGCDLIEQRLFPVVAKLFAHPDDDVSGALSEGIREYLQFIKQRPYGAVQRDIIRRILFVTVTKYKFEPDYDFQSAGEDEADFIEFRRTLKVLFDNIAQLDKELVLSVVQELLRTTLASWKTLPFQDVEVAIAFLYLLGEAVPQQSNDVIALMIVNLVSSEVSSHPHAAVRLQFFETCARFERLFTAEMLPPVVGAFLDYRGLRATNANVRSRCSYLFSKMIKSNKSKLEGYVEQILLNLQEFLRLPEFNQAMDPNKLSADDQLYLYEATAVLIITGRFPTAKKEQLLRQILSPLMQSFEMYRSQMALQPPQSPLRRQMASHMCHAIALTSRTSKAFTSIQTMRACACVDIYTKAISVFGEVLVMADPADDAAVASVHTALRQFLHRMVVCLHSTELVPFMSRTLGAMLGVQNAHRPIPQPCLNLLERTRPLQETIPLICQLLVKFKRDNLPPMQGSVPLMRDLFLPTVQLIFKCLEVAIEPGDQVSLKDRQTLQRAYFGLIQAMVLADILTAVISPQETLQLEQVFNTIIQGAVDFPDPVAQKTCFSILRKMVESWGKGSENVAFVRFMFDAILPACFQAPLKESFDLTDAQTALVLSESAHCIQSIFKCRGEELLLFLSNDLLLKLTLDAAQIQNFGNHMQQDIKIFRAYFRSLFEHLRKRGGL
ncbi:exportin-T-like [Tropilaelaps mercedesae]|uniref:Exportin-T n=1 Tax=Tropilaelaps mercedesae TaxID=418985 RepID=A0A1V9XSM8_9ACAR|nr:exportin-T-like [Tropilaelaps mercedesae]